MSVLLHNIITNIQHLADRGRADVNVLMLVSYLILDMCEGQYKLNTNVKLNTGDTIVLSCNGMTKSKSTAELSTTADSSCQCLIR